MNDIEKKTVENFLKNYFKDKPATAKLKNDIEFIKNSPRCIKYLQKFYFTIYLLLQKNYLKLSYFDCYVARQLIDYMFSEAAEQIDEVHKSRLFLHLSECEDCSKYFDDVSILQKDERYENSEAENIHIIPPFKIIDMNDVSNDNSDETIDSQPS